MMVNVTLRNTFINVVLDFDQDSDSSILRKPKRGKTWGCSCLAASQEPDSEELSLLSSRAQPTIDKNRKTQLPLNILVSRLFGVTGF